jgi:hypothetical protein
MKKLLCVVPVLLLFAMIGAPNARADSYTPTFSCTPPLSSDFGCYFVSNGYTAPDVSFPSPTVQVTVSNEMYDVTLSTGDGPTDSYTYEFAEANGTAPPPFHNTLFGGLSIDDLTTGTMNNATDFLGYDMVAPPLIGEGTLTFSPVSAASPEPIPVILMLLGVGLIFLVRKRFIMPAARIA